MNLLSSFQLEAKQLKGATEPLLAFLNNHRGTDVEISAQNVDTLSGIQIELLLCGYRQWQLEEHSFSVVAASPDLILRLTNVGVPTHLFSEGS